MWGEQVLFEFLIAVVIILFLSYVRANEYLEIQSFKKKNPTAADYAIMIENLPPTCDEASIRRCNIRRPAGAAL